MAIERPHIGHDAPGRLTGERRRPPAYLGDVARRQSPPDALCHNEHHSGGTATASVLRGRIRDRSVDLLDPDADRPSVVEHDRFGAVSPNRVRQQAALADFGRIAVGGSDLSDLFELATVVLVDALDADYAHVLRYLPDVDGFLLEAGVGWPSGQAGTLVLEGVADAYAHQALSTCEPILVTDVTTVRSFWPVVGPRRLGGSSGALITIGVPGRPYGLLGAGTRRPGGFSQADLHFLTCLAHLLSLAIERHRADRIVDAVTEHSHDLAVRFDAGLRCRYASSSLSVTTGIAPEAWVGRALGELGIVPATQVASWTTALRSVLRSGRERECELAIGTLQGDRWYRVSIVPDLSVGNTVQSVLVLGRDVTETRRAIEESAEIRRELLERERRHQKQIDDLLVERRAQQRLDDDAARIARQITPREAEILRMVTDGLTNQQIAARLHLSAGTVRNHLGRLFPKLDAADRTQAAVRAVELGLTRAGIT